MVPREYPVQQKKTNAVVNELFELASSKTIQEKAALQIAEETDNKVKKQLATAIAKSNRIMAEDIIREAGYMIPQSGNVNEFLKSLKQDSPADFPIEIVEKLLTLIQVNEKTEVIKMEQWKCTVCGYIHEGTLEDDFKCPRCNQPASVFVKVEETVSAENKYAGTKTEIGRASCRERV